MSAASNQRSEEFLKISGQFKLGALVTESSHPITAHLSEVAKQDIAKALDLLFQVDGDVLNKYREFVESGRGGQIQATVLEALKQGGRMFFTGCGSTGRLSIQLVSIWRDFWQQQRAKGFIDGAAEDWEDRALSVMAGGDFALIKSVEGFEDFAAFGKKQIGDLGVSNKDVVFAITEGGETSFVIGTAWQGVEAGAKVYFVYNNPDDVLCEHVQRSREVIADARIEKINLTTGPMAITGSTRMQATSIQLCVMLTVMEMVVRDLVAAEVTRRKAAGLAEMRTSSPQPSAPLLGREGKALDASNVPTEFLSNLTELHGTLRSPEVLSELAKLVALEESVYRSGRKNNYYADRFGIDVLTDTTERSPTYCTPPFRKFDDTTATESWSFLFVPDLETPQAWQRILKRDPHCVEWTESETRALVGEEKFSRTNETVRKISRAELMRFKIGLDGLSRRRLNAGDSAIGILSAKEHESLTAPEGFYHLQLEAAQKAGAKLGLVYLGPAPKTWDAGLGTLDSLVVVPVPKTDFLLEGVTRVGVKLLLNALSTCTMVRLGRVMGNYMIWVVASNLKLIDRATRYIQKLTGLAYEDSNRLLFEAVEYIEPRMKADQAYPPVVGLAVMRARHNLSNEEAERRLKSALA
jgi:N-acetylmuramic acid 6-phosphate etherase